jgi:ABC-type Fe3+ transport system substrate-binding protein
MFAVAQSNLRVNRDVIPETELRTPRELVDPRWKGQIVLNDPRSGSGTAVLGSFLVAYGEDLVRDILGKQEVVVTRDTRQQVEWVVRGRYPIGIGVVPRDLAIFRQQGLGLNVRPLREPATILTSSGGIMLLNRAPHPNAARVFINWLLTRDAQSRITQKLGEYNSARLDVPPVDPESYPDAARLNEYINTQSETILPQLQRAESLAKELLP